MIDRRTVKTVQDVVDKVTGPFWDREELAYYAYKFLVQYRDHYLLRRKKAARQQAEEDKAAAKVLAEAQQKGELSSSSPVSPPQREALLPGPR